MWPGALLFLCVPVWLAPIIDTILLACGHTMCGIVRELIHSVGAACRGKDFKANVRARLYWLRRKGCRVPTPLS